MSLPSSAAAATLRESFGDRKLPDISRKITACVLCRKLKIKCHMTHSKPPCLRCKARGLSCQVNKSIQALLENDASWKEEIERRVRKVEDALVHTPNHQQDESPANADVVNRSLSLTRTGTNSLETPSIQQVIDGPATNISLNLSCSLGSFPASSITNISFDHVITDPSFRPDLISCGVVSLQNATDYFDFYMKHLDSRMHYLLTEDDSLASIRERSSLLTTAICTVATFCMGSKEYHQCLKMFTNEVSRKLFSDKYEFDDVRALCIGALWLNDVSSVLNGLAVRISTQLDLHRCITKMPHTKKECYDRTRLYFLVYLCDHHCSLIYGRPPMTTEFRSLKGPGSFLQSEFSSPADLDLISLVEFWSINRRIFELFGSDIESTIINQKSIELGRLNSALDKWHQDWQDAVSITDTPSSLTPRVFDLYFHSAKLYLFSHLFRGPSYAQSPAGADETDRLTAYAAENALAILQRAVDRDDCHHWLEKLPYYFGTMIAFASVCLIRTSLREDHVHNDQKREILRYLHRVPQVIHMSSLPESSSHPLMNIAKSLERAICERTGSTQETGAAPEFDVENSCEFAFDFDLFANDPLNLTFPGGEDNWMLCPEQIGLSTP